MKYALWSSRGARSIEYYCRRLFRYRLILGDSIKRNRFVKELLVDDQLCSGISDGIIDGSGHDDGCNVSGVNTFISEKTGDPVRALAQLRVCDHPVIIKQRQAGASKLKDKECDIYDPRRWRNGAFLSCRGC